MVTSGMITLLGVGHVFDIGAAIRAEVLARRPKVVALEVEAELQRFYRDEQSFLSEFAAELPTAKRILIDERDVAMARTLREIAESRGDVVAVVGEGHVEGLLHHLAGVPVEVIHLEQLRSLPAGPNASVNVSVHL